MAFELDHMFVAVRPGAPEVARIVTAGFEDGPRNHHPGQGTASTGVLFENSYVEFLWLEDSSEAELPGIRRTCLAQRADPEQRALPFGFGMRHAPGSENAVPFSTWEYRPPYLPAGTSILMGCNSELLAEPLLFVLPWKSGPGYDCPRHPNKAREVTAVSLLVPEGGDMSREFTAFCSLGLVTVDLGDSPLLSVELDHGRTGSLLDLRPRVPFVIRW